MSANKGPLLEEMEHPIIRTQEEVEQHDGFESAYLLISGSLIQGVYILEHGRNLKSDTGALLRGVEMLLMGIGETNSRCMVEGLRQAVGAMSCLLVTAQGMREEQLPAIPGKRRRAKTVDISDPDEEDPTGGLH